MVNKTLTVVAMSRITRFYYRLDNGVVQSNGKMIRLDDYKINESRSVK